MRIDKNLRYSHNFAYFVVKMLVFIHELCNLFRKGEEICFKMNYFILTPIQIPQKSTRMTKTEKNGHLENNIEVRL